MSYEYFLQAYLNREPQKIETARILEVFRDYIVETFPEWVNLEFDEGNRCTIYMDTSSDYAARMMVSRPCGGQLGECLYKVMQLGNFVFFEPDGYHVIILQEDVAGHLPKDMVEGLGGAVVGGTMEEFLRLYMGNR